MGMYLDIYQIKDISEPCPRDVVTEICTSLQSYVEVYSASELWLKLDSLKKEMNKWGKPVSPKGSEEKK